MGTVFSIQRFSIHDGPGIRTTVFFKGCPLSCVWCHNPESHDPAAEQAYTASRCVGCGRCVAACPGGALTLSEGKVRLDRARCTHCFGCVSVCPTEAWKRYGEDYTVDELSALVLRDRRYYEKSGGGVTLSGGEPLLQSAFAAELLARLRGEGIHTAIETSLWGRESDILALAPLCDLWMVDIKQMDDARHRALCGVSVEPILRHIRLLSDLGANVIVRVPVVAGESGTVENMGKMADLLLNDTAIRTVELLPLHALAEHKYASLFRPYGAAALTIPTSAQMQELRDYLRSRGLTVPEPEEQ